jgi:hypothetical protein
LLSKLLFWTIALTLFAKVIFLPRFAELKAKLDRFVNAFLVVLVLVYAVQLVLVLRR